MSDIRHAFAFAALAAGLAAAGPAPAEEAADPEGADWGLDLRYRFEFVDEEGFENNAEASTLRGRLRFASAAWKGFSVLAEGDYVTNVIWDDYDAGGGNTPDRAAYPVVADPDGADLNQAWVQYARGAHRFRAGRQRIVYDNARFVGNVVWRQNEQTYDAVSWRALTESFDLQYAWVDNVNRIFGNDVPAGDQAQDTHLLNASWKAAPGGPLTGYVYLIDNEDAASLSSDTWGLRYAAGERFAWGVEYARQADAADNPVDYDADYWRIDLAWNGPVATPYVGWEVLGGDADRPGSAFRTPLATLHAFNGWADRFLNTPDEGLDDRFVGLKGKAGAWSWNVLYHDFSGEDGGNALGSEIDASISRPFAGRYALLLKAARFDGEDPRYADVTKLWLQLTASY